MLRTPPLPPLCALLAALALPACTGGGGGGGAAQAPPSETKGSRVPEAERLVETSRLSAEDTAELERSWRLFLDEDPRWVRARKDWLAKGEPAAYVLAENLFRYFWGASAAMKKDAVRRVAREAEHVGAPAVGYFLDLLVLDRWKLREAATTRVFNPDNAGRPLEQTVTHIEIDDVTRQNAAWVLAAIGEPAVPGLTGSAVARAPRPSSRTYAYYALGTIGSDAAVAHLARVLQGSGSWQDRGAAAKALGFALAKNPAARSALEPALKDADDFVRRKAALALEGKSSWEV
jgi:hypothetical protein